MEKERESLWETESGFLEEADFWIEKAHFGFMEEYASEYGNPTLLIWRGFSPDTGREHRIIWPLGAGWEAVDDGKRCHHPRRQKFVRTSIYGRLLDRCMKELGEECKKTLIERGLPTEAKVWEGLGFRMVVEEFEYAGLLEERGGKTRHLMPVAFLGVKEKVAPEVPKFEIPPEIEEELRNLAKSSPDMRTWQQAAIKVKGVAGNAELLARILSGELYEKLR